MNSQKEMDDFFKEFLRKYESGEIPKEPWESEPPPELHLFKFRLKTTPPPNPLAGIFGKRVVFIRSRK